jgi:hypothetical protein
MSVRLVPAPISITYAPVSENAEEFLREYHKLSEIDDDPIAQWLKISKAKGYTAQSDPVILNLLIELYRKVDGLEKFLKNEEPVRAHLSSSCDIESIGFSYFQLTQNALHVGDEYYGRVEMPVYPKRDIALFFKAIDTNLAEITKMHLEDEKAWNIYLTARERIMIREMKESKS